jgi:putative endonuclease
VASTRVPPDQWTDPRHRDGWDGELLAAEWLIDRGWRIEAHRFRIGRHDLDLVARRGGIVAFIEVKTRRSSRCGSGMEAIGARKRRTIERLAWGWILKHGRSGDQYRFDVASLDGFGPGARVSYLEDAWRPSWR